MAEKREHGITPVDTDKVPVPPPTPAPNGERRGLNAWFSHFAARFALWAGKPVTFILACAALIIWVFFGPPNHYSDTWQLVINTATTIVTFLMVFLIQNTQNRDARAIHLKLDEIIRSIRPAHNEMIDIEKLSDRDLEDLSKHYEAIRAEARARSERRQQQNEDAA